ncbi:MAG: dipeptidase [Alphaproteobacteria bacterium]|nr:dipeptidase [Alphaproteobacteria bacterium]
MDRDKLGSIVANEQTQAFHDRAFVFDSLTIPYIVNEPYTERVLKAGVNATILTTASEQDWDETLRRTETTLEAIEKHPLLCQATTVSEIEAAQSERKLAIMLGTQGSFMLGDDISRLDILFRLGIRSFGLAYTGPTLFADGCGERRDAGVSFLGEELIEHVNTLPMMLDLSHCGHRTRREGADAARAPINTHSNSYAVFASDRNTKDETLTKIAEKGGMNGVVFHPVFVKRPKSTLEDVLDHVDHICELIGWENVGFGTDYLDYYQDNEIQVNPRWHELRPDMFAGIGNYFGLMYPDGLENIRLLPNFTQGLFDRGYSEQQVTGILGGNWLRTVRNLVG